MSTLTQVDITHAMIPDWVIPVALVVLLLSGVVYFIVFIVNRRQMALADKALHEGRLADAFRSFLFVAQLRFPRGEGLKIKASSPDMFEKAIQGIEKVYRAAAIPADLSKLRKLRKELLNVLLDPKRQYHGFSGSKADGFLTNEGINTRDRIIAEANAFISQLPIPWNATGADSAAQSPQLPDDGCAQSHSGAAAPHSPEPLRNPPSAQNRPHVRFQCPRCRKTLTAASESAGKRAKCPGCGLTLVLPAAPGHPRS